MPSYQFRKKQFLLFASLWSICLLVFSLLPHDFIWNLAPSERLQSLAHTAAYGFLTYLLCFYLRFRRSLIKLRMTDMRVYFFACAFTLIWGVVTEFAQMFRADRFSDWNDCLFNAVGSMIGLMVFLIWQFFHHRRVYRPS